MASDTAIMLAIQSREALFGTLDEMVSNTNYLRVLFSLEEHKTQAQIARELGVGGATVSRGIKELTDLGLIQETEQGHVPKMEVLGDPLIQFLFWEEWGPK